MLTSKRKSQGKKGLQKLTESQKKIADLFKLPKVKEEMIKGWSNEERDLLSQSLTKKFNEVNPDEKKNLINQFEDVISPATKYEIWETNHNSITAAISNLMQEKRRMPSVKEIAERAELSRQTVYKHLKEYKSSPVYLDQVQKYEFMTQKVLTNLFIFAINGDVAAAKVYLSAFGKLDQGQTSNTLIQQQNNFVQINGAVISQDKISRLDSEQLKRLEQLIKEFSFTPS